MTVSTIVTPHRLGGWVVGSIGVESTGRIDAARGRCHVQLGGQWTPSADIVALLISTQRCHATLAALVPSTSTQPEQGAGRTPEPGWRAGPGGASFVRIGSFRPLSARQPVGSWPPGLRKMW